MMDAIENGLWDMLTKLDADYRAKRVAILTTISVHTGRPVEDIERDAARTAQPKASASNHGEFKNQLHIVRWAVTEEEGAFTKDDIAKTLKSGGLGVVTKNTLANLSSFLWRLQKDGEIQVKEQGKGQRQSVYVRAAPQQKEPAPVEGAGS